MVNFVDLCENMEKKKFPFLYISSDLFKGKGEQVSNYFVNMFVFQNQE